MKRLYLDYASLTPADKRVLRHVRKFETGKYMNPSSLYRAGVASKRTLAESREKIAKVIGAHHDEIIFTAGGTEANNLALRGIVEKASKESSGKNPHIIVSAIEHSSIVETARALEKRGIMVSYIPVNSDGVIDVAELKKALTSETVLVSVMMVNNELGTIQPVHEIAKIIRLARKNSGSAYPLFHTDACQAGYLPLLVEKLGIDLLTLDGQKIYGPRGMGMLYVKRGIELEPVIYGGGQEKGLRSGTENVPAIAGFAYAIELTDKMREGEFARLSALKAFFMEGLAKIHPQIKANASADYASPHILNVSIPNIDNEFFVLQMDARGIACSTKSACLRDEDESYVLKAIGRKSSNSIRFSFGRETKKSDLVYALRMIGEILRKTL